FRPDSTGPRVRSWLHSPIESPTTPPGRKGYGTQVPPTRLLARLSLEMVPDVEIAPAMMLFAITVRVVSVSFRLPSRRFDVTRMSVVFDAAAPIWMSAMMDPAPEPGFVLAMWFPMIWHFMTLN